MSTKKKSKKTSAVEDTRKPTKEEMAACPVSKSVLRVSQSPTWFIDGVRMTDNSLMFMFHRDGFRYPLRISAEGAFNLAQLINALTIGGVNPDDPPAYIKRAVTP